MEKQQLTAEQHRRLAKGLHGQAGMYEEWAQDGISVDGHLKQAELCRKDAYEHELEAERLEKEQGK